MRSTWSGRWGRGWGDVDGLDGNWDEHRPHDQDSEVEVAEASRMPFFFFFFFFLLLFRAAGAAYGGSQARA